MALLPGAYEEVVGLVNAVVLTDKVMHSPQALMQSCSCSVMHILMLMLMHMLMRRSFLLSLRCALSYLISVPLIKHLGTGPAECSLLIKLFISITNLFHGSCSRQMFAICVFVVCVHKISV